MSQALITPIKELNLSTRSYNALMRHGITTIEKLEKTSNDELLQGVKNFGVKCLEEVTEALRKYKQQH